MKLHEEDEVVEKLKFKREDVQYYLKSVKIEN
jgi:hypothetical protein